MLFNKYIDMACNVFPGMHQPDLTSFRGLFWWKFDALQIIQFLAWFAFTTVTTWLVVRLTLPTKSFLIFSCTFHPSHKLRGIHTHCLPKWTRDNLFCDLMSYDCKAITLQSVRLPNDVKRSITSSLTCFLSSGVALEWLIGWSHFHCEYLLASL